MIWSKSSLHDRLSLWRATMFRGSPVCLQMCLKTMFLKERLEGTCIFLPLQCRISLTHLRNFSVCSKVDINKLNEVKCKNHSDLFLIFIFCTMPTFCDVGYSQTHQTSQNEISFSYPLPLTNCFSLFSINVKWFSQIQHCSM